MKRTRVVVGGACVLGLMVFAACQKESGDRDVGAGDQGRDLDDWSMCCGGKKNETDEGEGWCSVRCEKDEDCPGGCLCSCEGDGCSVVVAFGSFGNSDRQCVAVEYLKEIGWRMMKKDGGSMR